jgi:hypothetical protein
MQNITLNCLTNETGQTCTINSAEPFVTPFFSSGEILIALFLFILILLQLVKILAKGINSVSIIREFQGNNSPDGKEKYKI